MRLALGSPFILCVASLLSPPGGESVWCDGRDAHRYNEITVVAINLVPNGRRPSNRRRSRR